jgi:hypothetical protein
MRIPLLILAAIAVVLTGCNKSGSDTSAQSTNTVGPAGYLKNVVHDEKSANKTIDVSYLNQALQQFNVQEGRYPKTLDERVPNYVAKLPPVPYGYRLDYDADNGVVKVVEVPQQLAPIKAP